MAALLSAHLAVLSPSNELQGQKPELCWDGKTWLARILGSSGVAAAWCFANNQEEPKVEGVECISLVVQYLSRWELSILSVCVCVCVQVCVHVCEHACLQRVLSIRVAFAASDCTVPGIVPGRRGFLGSSLEVGQRTVTSVAMLYQRQHLEAAGVS